MVSQKDAAVGKHTWRGVRLLRWHKQTLSNYVLLSTNTFCEFDKYIWKFRQMQKRRGCSDNTKQTNSFQLCPYSTHLQAGKVINAMKFDLSWKCPRPPADLFARLFRASKVLPKLNWNLRKKGWFYFNFSPLHNFINISSVFEIGLESVAQIQKLETM